MTFLRPEGAELHLVDAEPDDGEDHSDVVGDQRSIRDTLERVCAFVGRFVVLTAAQRDAIGLWVLHTHALDAADCTAYMAVTSAEKRSGKTRLLEVLDLLVARPWFTGRVTAAVLARKIDAEAPTLLLDESDAAFGGEKEYAEALRGILNTGYRRGGSATVCVGQGMNISYKDFSTFSAKAIAGIGTLPDTVADRSIPIRLERRAPSETVERLRRRDVEPEAEPLRDQLATLSLECEILAGARPVLPDELDDRAQDVCEPLLAIADLAGDDWPRRARAALVGLCAGRQIADDDSLRVRLLSDIRDVLGDDDRITTAVLLARLEALDDAPWSDWFGRAFTSRALSKLLRPYGIRIRTIRLHDDGTARGLLREQFEPVWGRYLASYPTHRHNPHEHWENADSVSDTTGAMCRIGNGQKPALGAECVAVSDRKPNTAREESA
jgi:hypothetical protein